MADTSRPLDRHFQYFRRQMWFGLLFYLAWGIGTVAALMRPGTQPALSIVPGVAFLAVFFASHLVLRRRGWLEPDPAGHTLADDECVNEIHRRSNKVALRTVFFGQVPLMFFVAYLSDEPTVEGAVVGMAILTMVVVGVSLCISILYYSRTPADG